MNERYENLSLNKEFLPKKKIGYIYPLRVIDYSAYQIYQLMPRIMLVISPINLKDFTSEHVELAFDRLEEDLEMFVEREVDIIMQAGVPLPIIMGLEYHDQMIEFIRKTTGLPATSSIMNVVASTKFMGIQNIALANKWSHEMNHVLGSFFEREGIGVAGINSEPMTPGQFTRLNTGESLQLAYNLGRKALENFPDSDGLYIGGGAWLTIPIIQSLEDEFERPVITNENATIWNLSRLLRYGEPIYGYGRLLQGI